MADNFVTWESVLHEFVVKGYLDSTQDIEYPLGYVSGHDRGLSTKLQYFHSFEKKYEIKRRYYAFILYPDNLRHLHFLYRLISCRYSLCFIRHSPDDVDVPSEIYSEESDVDISSEYRYKEHIHVLVKYTSSKPWYSVIRDLFKHGVFYCVPINKDDPCGYIEYMVHRTLDCQLQKKPVYDWDCLYRNNDFVSMVSILMYRIGATGSCTQCNAMGEILYLIQLHAPDDYEGLVLDVFNNEFLVNTWQRNQMTVNNLCVRYGYELFDKKHNGNGNGKGIRWRT